jgi:2OG-Fe(II) oxygenase superfamily
MQDVRSGYWPVLQILIVSRVLTNYSRESAKKSMLRRKMDTNNNDDSPDVKRRQQRLQVLVPGSRCKLITMKTFLFYLSLLSSTMIGSIFIMITIPTATSFQHLSLTIKYSPRISIPAKQCDGLSISCSPLTSKALSYYPLYSIRTKRSRSRMIFSKSFITDDSTTTSTITARVKSFLRKNDFKENKIVILSEDPLVYTISDLLSKSECLDYQKYAIQNKNMTISNPPDVSLDTAKLWPLPLFSVGFGIPPYIRLLASNSNDFDSILGQDILITILPPIFMALALMVTLAWFVVLPLAKLVSKNQSRTSTAAALNLDTDVEFIRPLVERVSKAIYKNNENGYNDIGSTSNWEAPVITKYDTGAIFARHNDASPTRGSEWSTIGGQRVVTCICYLNTLTNSDSNGTVINSGGETYFDSLNIDVQPKAGTALIFYPADAMTLNADDRTTHESKPVKSGEKWIVQMFGRIQPVPPPLGLPTSF